MKKLENLTRCLDSLRRCDAALARRDEIYRMGVIGQFNLSFELAWKAMQAVLTLHGVSEAATGSPREIIKQGYRVGFLGDEAIWLDMLKRRNTAVHVYNEAEADALAGRILTDYLPAMERLRDSLSEKVAQLESE